MKIRTSGLPRIEVEVFLDLYYLRVLCIGTASTCYSAVNKAITLPLVTEKIGIPGKFVRVLDI